MPAFTCNVCGARNEAAEKPDSQRPSCGCGSNVRTRALVHLLSMELFGQSFPLPEFPRLRAIRGIGMTDDPSYAKPLAEKFDYTNTYYDREPRFDITEPHPDTAGTLDFILCADVIEHIAPPMDRALKEACRLLKPNGFLIVTVPCPQRDTLEHFPDLHQYRVVPLGDRTVLVNRRRDGSIEVADDLLFHDGQGTTLEMRQLSPTDLRDRLLAGGFREVEFLCEEAPQIGVFFDENNSQPLIARKERFEISGPSLHQFIDYWHTMQARRDLLEKQVSMASESRWVRLGRKFGVGPRFS